MLRSLTAYTERQEFENPFAVVVEHEFESTPQELVDRATLLTMLENTTITTPQEFATFTLKSEFIRSIFANILATLKFISVRIMSGSNVWNNSQGLTNKALGQIDVGSGSWQSYSLLLRFITGNYVSNKILGELSKNNLLPQDCDLWDSLRWIEEWKEMSI